MVLDKVMTEAYSSDTDTSTTPGSWTNQYTEISEDSRYRICKICIEKKKSSPSKWANKTSGVTGNISKHLLKHHGVTKGIVDAPVTVGPLARHLRTKMTSSIFNRVAAEWIITDGRPFSIGESKSFIKMMNAWKRLPMDATFPSRTTIANCIDPMFFEMRQEIQKCLSSVNSRIHLTLDSWTSPFNSEFLAIACHFLDKNWVKKTLLIEFQPLLNGHSAVEVFDVVKNLVTELDFESKLGCITADSASSNIKLADMIMEWYSDKSFSFSAFTHVRCLAHVVHLAAMEAVSEIAHLLRNVRSYSEFISRSSKRNSHYLKSREEEGFTGRFLVSDVSTRWDSTYEMLNVFLDQQHVISRFQRLYSHQDDELHIFSNEEISTLTQITELLKPFQSATKLFSGKTLLSEGSIYFSILVDKMNSLSEAEDLEDIIKNAAKRAHRKLSQYFGRFL